MDVDVLRMAMTRFKQQFMDVMKIHPYKQSATIAGACMNAFRYIDGLHLTFRVNCSGISVTVVTLVGYTSHFRANYLPEHQLPIFDESGHRKSSKEAALWLAYIQQSEDVTLRTAASQGGEYSLSCLNQLSDSSK
jgi:hypothetical protein